MDLINLELKKGEMEMNALIEKFIQLKQKKERMEKGKQDKYVSIREQMSRIQIGDPIQSLEEMIHTDLTYNVPIEYYEQPIVNGHLHPYKNGTKKKGMTFDVIKEQMVNSLLPITNRKRYTIYEFSNECGMSGGPSIESQAKVSDTIPSLGMAVTSDKFVVMLNIIKQQDARIKALEEEWGNRMDEKYENGRIKKIY